MFKKFAFALVVPVLAVAAFAVIPAMASAAPAWFVCSNVGAGEGMFETKHCTNSGGEEEWAWVKLEAGQELMVLSHGTEPFTLKTEGGGIIECTTLHDDGTLLGGEPGKDDTTLHFSGCLLNGACPVNDVVGAVLSELEAVGSNVFDKISIDTAIVVEGTPGFSPCPEGPIGAVTGSASGKISGSSIVFTAAGGLKFNTEKATINGTDVQETLSGELVTAK